MGLTPEYRIIANGADATATIRERFMSLSFTDEAGLESDTLEIVLADNQPENPIQMPDTGAELELFLGYDGEAQRIGLFIVDEIEISGWPGEMVIRANAAPFDTSKGGKANLQSQKTRKWDAGTTLGALVKKIANEHGLEPAVSKSLAGIALPHLAQSDESDGHFLVRLARKYDAVVKPAGGKLIMAKKGEGSTVSGQPLPAVTLKPEDVTEFSMRLARREASGSVVAAWHQSKKAQRHTVTVGEGEPVTRLRMQYSTRDMALAAAQAEMDKRARGETSLSITLPGRPDLVAEAPLELEGFRDGVAGSWIIKRVAHELGPDGYVCSIEGEAPNSASASKVTEATD